MKTTTTKNSKLHALAEELAKDLKTPTDLSNFTSELTKIAVEAALKAEMDEHIGYSHNDPKGYNSGNSRNGYSTKKLKSNHGEIEISTPRDRTGSFEPKLIKKGQRRICGMDDQILSLYAKGMSTRDIVEAFEEMYGAEISPSLISQVTDKVMEDVTVWRNRPLESVYPVLYLDCLVIKIRENNQVLNKSLYLALGVDMTGHKDLLGMWLSENEGAKFWLGVMTELQNRGLEQVLIACVDGLTGFPEAIASVYPQAKVQLCIVHMVRNSMRYVSYKDRKELASDLKKVYQASSESEAKLSLDNFAEKWDEKYPSISKSWRDHWVNIITIFEFGKDIRKAIYTTNAIESLNSVIRKSTKTRKLFPNDESALKLVYLATQAASKKWTMPIRDWHCAMSQFIIQFEEILTPYL